LKPESPVLPRRGRARVSTRPVLSGMAAATLLALASSVHAFSLGRMNVLSALGEPLRAEIDVTSLSAEQTASLQVGLASAEVYRAAGMDYSELLRGTQVTLTRRPDGRSVLQVSSDRAARDPFIDLILQATWANGRLVREYTVLLDPPRPDAPSANEPRPAAPANVAVDVAPAAPVASASMATAAPAAAAPPAAPAATPAPAPARPVAATPAPPVPALPPAASSTRSTSSSPSAPSPAPGRTASTLPGPAAAAGGRALSSTAPAARPAAPATASASPSAKVRARPAATSRTSPPSIAGKYTVKAGDTLYRIARDARPEAVSLDQMLVALYRSNPRAFSGDNMNRLFAGAVLTVPDAAAVAGITPGEARQVIQAHSADMTAYRQRLAARAGLMGEDSATRASGRVEALVQDRTRPASASPDQLKLSQASVAGKPAPEAALSQQAAAQEAGRREGELQRNIEALKQLEGDAKTASGPAGAPTTGDRPAGSVVAGTAGGESAGLPAVAAAQPALADAPAQPGAEAATPSSPAAADATAPAPAGADTEDAHSPMLAMYGLAAGGALGTLLLALGGARWIRRRKGKAGASFLPEHEAIEPSGDLPEVPSLNASTMSFDDAVAQRMGAQIDPGPEAAEPRSADPVAEADVYIAYGRLQQAEGLLQSAMRDEPHRLDIQVKLLELHAMQKDLEAFDAQAETLYEMSGGQGPEWTRALSLRRSLAPAPAPAPRASAAEPDRSFEDDVDLAFPPEPAGTLAPTLDANEVSAMARAPRPVPVGASSLPPRPTRPEALPSLGPEPQQTEAGDFSLDLDATVVSRPPRPQRDVDLGQTPLPGAADPEAGDPLDRKLALAEEFIQIGDVEGARDLLVEVDAKGDGPLKERAQRLLSTLG